MKKSLIVSFFVLVSAFAQADTYVWTGAANAYWTNAANWQVNGDTATVPPGRYIEINGSGNAITNGSGKAVVHFNAACTTGRTTIDLDGLVTVFGVVMDGGAAAPRYTLGTGPSQRLPIEPAGFFGAADTIDTVPPVLNCGFAFGQWAYSNQARCYVTNLNQTVALEFGEFGWCSPAPDATVFEYNQNMLYLCGYKGNFVFNGDYQKNGAVRLSWTVANNQGKIRVNAYMGSFVVPTIDTAGSNYQIELGPNGVLDGRGSYGGSLISTWRQLNITGEGKMIFPVRWADGAWNATSTINWNFYARYPQLLDVEYTSVWGSGSGSKPDFAPGIAFYNADDGEGHIVTLAGVNCVTGTVRLAGYSGGKHPIYQISNMGLDGERSGLGYGPDVQLNDLCTLRVTTASENCDRTIRLSRAFGTNDEDYGGILELTGSGVHTMASPVVCEGADCSFTVKSPGTVRWTVPLADTGDNRLSLVKTGMGTLVLEATNTCSGSCLVSQGTLKIGAAGSLNSAQTNTLAASTILEFENRAEPYTQVLDKLKVSGANAKIIIGRHTTLEIDALDRLGDGSLNVEYASNSSRLKVVSLAGGAAPAWLTVNGGSANVDAEGNVSAVSTSWNNLEGGSWNNPNNWTAGLPTVFLPGLVQLDADELNVCVDTADAEAGSVKVFNEVGLTTLSLSRTLAFAAKKETVFGVGSRLFIGNGGKLVYEDEYFGSGKENGDRNTSNRNLHPFMLKDGAEWVVDGGHLYITNLQGRLLVGDGVDMSVTSRLEFVRGTFDFGQGGWDSGLEIRPNGVFKSAGGELVFQGKGSADTPFKMRGGRAVFAGDTAFKVLNGNGSLDKNACTVFGSGETVFKDNAKMYIFQEMSNYGQGAAGVMPETDGATATLTFLDSATMTNQVGTFIVGNHPNNTRQEHSECNDNRAILNLLGSGEHVGGYPGRPDVGLANMFCIGSGSGYGELNITGGRLNSGCYGMECPNFVNTANMAPRGRVNQSGGTIYLNAFAHLSINYNRSRPTGFLLGDASLVTYAPAAGYPDAFRGEYEMSGGRLSLNCGSAVIGGGRGSGRMAITGGEVVLGETMTYSQNNIVDEVSHKELATNRYFVAVGYLGGQGELVISNGAFTCNEDFYLGGVWTNRVFHGYAGTSKHLAVSAGDSGDNKTGRGRLELSGGAFTNRTTFTMGAFGTGVLDILGSAGCFKANNVTLSNDVAAVVNFRADAAGVTPVDADGVLTVAPGARVTLDVSNFTGHRLALFRYGTLEGELPEVELTGTGEQHNFEFQTRPLADGRQEYGFVWVKGTTIFFR